jgi:hypothetical protein
VGFKMEQNIISLKIKYETTIKNQQKNSNLFQNSIKNCILINNEEKEIIRILKILKNSLEIDSSDSYNPILVFCLEIAIFLQNKIGHISIPRYNKKIY